jgi:threonine/homoserine/homoserine lactone efflux protein
VGEDLAEVIAEVLPLALGIAASPFPIIPVILLLFTARPLAAGGAFLAGWAAGIAAATAAFVLLASLVEAFDEPPAWASWARIVLGAALLGLGAREWAGRHGREEPPAWMRSLEDATPATAGRLGLLLSAANPKILLLSAAAGLAIGAAELTAAGTWGAAAAFTALAAVTVALPVLLYAVLRERILRPLSVARDWLQANNVAVMAVVILVIGAFLVSKGLSGL